MNKVCGKLFMGVAALAATLLGTFSGPVYAVDGCKVMLCLAGNWRNIAECRPDVEQALRDVARGRGWPSCNTGGAGNNTAYNYVAPRSCPEQYRTTNGEINGRPIYECPFNGVVDVSVNGQLWSRVYTSTGGADSVTEWGPAALTSAAQTGTALDDRWARDLAAWRAAEAERQRLAAEAAANGGGG